MSQAIDTEGTSTPGTTAAPPTEGVAIHHASALAGRSFALPISAGTERRSWLRESTEGTKPSASAEMRWLIADSVSAS
jgi:hypothetical protein